MHNASCRTWMISLREKCPNMEFFLVRIFLHLHCPNAAKHGPEKLRNWTLPTQWFFFVKPHFENDVMTLLLITHTCLFLQSADGSWEPIPREDDKVYSKHKRKFIVEIAMEVSILKTYSENKFQEGILPGNRTATESTVTESIQWWWWALLVFKNQILQSRITLVSIF